MTISRDPMRRRARWALPGALLAALIAGALLLPGTADAEGARDVRLTVQGGIPAGGGIVATIWGGGATDALAADAATLGCAATSAWVFAGGEPIGFRFGSPPFVNAAFLARFPGGEVPGPTILLFVCGGASGPATAGDAWVPIVPTGVTVNNTGTPPQPGSPGVAGTEQCDDNGPWSAYESNGNVVTITGRGVGACAGWYRAERPLLAEGTSITPWFWIRADRTSLAGQAPPPDASLEALEPGCAARATLRSVTGNVPATVAITNETSAVVSITWLNYQGVEEPFTSVAPGQTLALATFLTHPWVVRSGGGTCLGVFLPDAAGTPHRVQ